MRSMRHRLLSLRALDAVARVDHGFHGERPADCVDIQ